MNEPNFQHVGQRLHFHSACRTNDIMDFLLLNDQNGDFSEQSRVIHRTNATFVPFKLPGQSESLDNQLPSNPLLMDQFQSELQHSQFQSETFDNHLQSRVNRYDNTKMKLCTILCPEEKSHTKRVKVTRYCSVPNCNRVLRCKGFCYAHGGRRTCKYLQCLRGAKSGGYCAAHVIV